MRYLVIYRKTGTYAEEFEADNADIAEAKWRASYEGPITIREIKDSDFELLGVELKGVEDEGVG